MIGSIALAGALGISLSATLTPEAVTAGEITSGAKAVEQVVEGGTNYATPGFEDWLNKGNADNKVYFGIKDAVAQYTGITKQSIEARLSQHNASGKGFQTLRVQFSDLTRNQARAIEQYFIENGPNLLNKINSISSQNKYYQDAMNWARDYLGVK